MATENYWVLHKTLSTNTTVLKLTAQGNRKTLAHNIRNVL